jgi:hypothetical protein
MMKTNGAESRDITRIVAVAVVVIGASSQRQSPGATSVLTRGVFSADAWRFLGGISVVLLQCLVAHIQCEG